MVDKIISGVEFFFLILLLWIIGRYGNLAPKVTDWKPLSAVNSHLVLASDEIFKTLNEPDICALLHQKRYKSYWTLTPIPCYFMTPSDADCIVHTAFLKASKEGVFHMIIVGALAVITCQLLWFVRDPLGALSYIKLWNPLHVILLNLELV